MLSFVFAEHIVARREPVHRSVVKKGGSVMMINVNEIARLSMISYVCENGPHVFANRRIERASCCAAHWLKEQTKKNDGPKRPSVKRGLARYVKEGGNNNHHDGNCDE